MKKILLILCVFFVGLQSHALFEVRAGYGINTLDNDNYNGSTIDEITGFNLDAIFYPPLIAGGLGFGLRHEMMGFAVGGTDADLTRTSLLVNYRFIDTLLHLGVIGTYALSEKVEQQNITRDPDGASMTIGVEGSVSLGLMSVGGELGKFFGTYEGAPNLKLNSTYIKILVGYGF